MKTESWTDDIFKKRSPNNSSNFTKIIKQKVNFLTYLHLYLQNYYQQNCIYPGMLTKKPNLNNCIIAEDIALSKSWWGTLYILLLFYR